MRLRHSFSLTHQLMQTTALLSGNGTTNITLLNGSIHRTITDTITRWFQLARLQTLAHQEMPSQLLLQPQELLSMRPRDLGLPGQIGEISVIALLFRDGLRIRAMRREL